MLQHYFISAIRNLLKYRTQNIISILGLAVGILCFTICLYLVRFANSIDKHFANHGRIAQLQSYVKDDGSETAGTFVTLVEDMRTQNIRGVETLTNVSYRHKATFNVPGKNDELLPYELRFIETDTCYNQVFTPKLLMGNWQTVSHAPNSVVMSRSTAIRIFGSTEAAIGKQVISTRRRNTAPKSSPKDGRIPYTVQAVMEDMPLNNGFCFMEHLDMIVVNDSEGLLQSERRRTMTGCRSYALLSPGISLKSLKEQTDQLFPHYKFYDMEAEIIPIWLTEKKSETIVLLSIIISLVGSLILSVGFINFFHFLIGSFLNCNREHSLRKLLGCTKRSLFMQLFTETFIIVACAGLLLMWLLEILTPHLSFSVELLTMHFEQTEIYLHAAQYLGLILLLCALICGLTTLRISRQSIQTGIFGGKRRRGKQASRNLMLGVQFFICWLFVASTVVVYMMIVKVNSSVFDSLTEQQKSEILSIPMNHSIWKNPDKLAMIERFKQSAGVKEVLLADINYLHGTSGNMLYVDEKRSKESSIYIEQMAVEPHFFTFMNLPIEQGRGLETESDMVVDRRLLDEWSTFTQPGMNLYGYKETYTICGVASSFRRTVIPGNQRGGTAFIPYNPDIYVGHCYLKCHPGRVEEVKQWVFAILREFLPSNLPVEVGTMQEDIDNDLVIMRAIARIVLFFAGVCIIITLLGVYSSITLDTERRKKEVAIRKVNGAHVPQIMLLFARLYIILLVGSAAVAYPLLMLILHFVKQGLSIPIYTGFFFWLALFFGVAAITFLTIVFRILQIARQNPAEVIKSE